MPIIRSGLDNKDASGGAMLGDASSRTAALRKQAIIWGQSQKETCATSLSAANQSKKPFMREHHLSKGFTKGVMEFMLVKNKDGIF
jgi:hypothetical protein